MNIEIFKYGLNLEIVVCSVDCGLTFCSMLLCKGCKHCAKRFAGYKGLYIALILATKAIRSAITDCDFR